MTGEGGKRGGRRREGGGGLSGNVAEEAFCLKSAPGCRTGHTSQTLVILHLRARGLGEGDEHLPMLSVGVR